MNIFPNKQYRRPQSVEGSNAKQPWISDSVFIQILRVAFLVASNAKLYKK